MRKTILFQIILFTCLTLSVYAQQNRIVGYLPYYQFDELDNIEFEKLTHLCIAFANPLDSLGNLDVVGTDITQAIQKGKAANLEVLISLGGALAPWRSNWQFLMQQTQRSNYIHKIIQYVQLYHLDGVDMDLEWGDVDSLYSPFVLELSDSLISYGYLLTAALPGTYRYPEISNDALDRFDFINMMVYDLTGPWNPNNPGQHSPYSFAVNSITYWKDVQHVERERLTLGVPFYGRDFTDLNNITAFTYNAMVDENPAYAQLDQVGQRYYNGIPTIMQKTMLCMTEVSGMMIWELGQDAFNEYSLLSTIFETMHPVAVPSIESKKDLFAYPNPFQDLILLKNNSNQLQLVGLFNVQGETIWEQYIEPNRSASINATSLIAGFYFVKFQTESKTFSSKLVKT